MPISPFFHPSLKVYNQSSEGDDDIYEINYKRIILLYTLFRFKIPFWYQSKVAIVPNEYDANRPLKLSFRLLISRFPNRLDQSFFKERERSLITLIGEKDEVTDSTKLKQLWCKHSKAPFYEFEGEDHNSIHYNNQVIDIIGTWLKP